MRYDEIINESHSSPLYHMMNIYKAQNVFQLDMMKAKWEHEIPGIGKVLGNSFTRNNRLKWVGRCIRITIDQEKLRHQNKIIPLDGQYCFINHSDSSIPVDIFIGNNPIKVSSKRDIRDRTISAHHIDYLDELNEEFVIGDIKNIHKIITNIYLFKGRDVYLNDHERHQAIEACENYSQKWNITIKIDNDFLPSP